MSEQIEMFSLPDAQVSLKMQCEDCGHIQIVKGQRLGGVHYFGSAYNWCDKCDTGLPKPIEDVRLVE